MGSVPHVLIFLSLVQGMSFESNFFFIGLVSCKLMNHMQEMKIKVGSKLPMLSHKFFISCLLNCSVQLSVKAGHKHSSAQTTSKKDSTRIDKTAKHVDLSERTDALSEVTSMGYLDPKHSSADDSTEGPRGAPLYTVLPNFLTEKSHLINKYVALLLL